MCAARTRFLGSAKALGHSTVLRSDRPGFAELHQSPREGTKQRRASRKGWEEKGRARAVALEGKGRTGRRCEGLKEGRRPRQTERKGRKTIEDGIEGDHKQVREAGENATKRKTVGK